MARTKVMSIPDFLRDGWREERTIDVVFAHMERHKVKYRVIGSTVVLFIGLSGVAFAADTSTAGIDKRANEIYHKILSVAKWVIVGKGAIDIIKHVSDGDLQAAKKGFLGYALVYGMLYALPWALDEIDHLFEKDV